MMSALAGDRFRPPKKKQEDRPLTAAPQKSSAHFNVVMLPEAQEGYAELPGKVKASIDQIAGRLAAWPEVSGVRSIWGQTNLYRMKTWDWRVEFIVDKQTKTITITRVGHRTNFYDEYH